MYYLANHISNKLAKLNIIKKDMIDIYRYGLEILISSSLTSFAIIIIAALLDSFIYGILYLALTIPLRISAGGYHAKTYRNCFLLSNVTYIATSLITRLLQSLNLPFYFWLVILYLSLFYIRHKAPVQNPNQPLSLDLLIKNKRRVVIYMHIYLFLFSILTTIYPTSPMVHFCILSISTVAILIIPTQRKGGAL